MRIIHKILNKTNIVDEKMLPKKKIISSIIKINANLIILGKK